MKTQQRYSKGPIGSVRIVEDFLPRPAEMVLRAQVDQGGSSIASHHEYDLRTKAIANARASAVSKVVDGPSAERSQDFLYDDEGLPK
jgi:hypothetical protein